MKSPPSVVGIFSKCSPSSQDPPKVQGRRTKCNLHDSLRYNKLLRNVPTWLYFQIVPFTVILFLIFRRRLCMMQQQRCCACVRACVLYRYYDLKYEIAYKKITICWFIFRYPSSLRPEDMAMAYAVDALARLDLYDASHLTRTHAVRRVTYSLAPVEPPPHIPYIRVQIIYSRM